MNVTADHSSAADPFETPIAELPGIRPQRVSLLRALNVKTIRDLLWLIPKSVLDLTQLSRVNELTDDRIHTIRGRIAILIRGPFHAGGP